MKRWQILPCLYSAGCAAPTGAFRQCVNAKRTSLSGHLEGGFCHFSGMAHTGVLRRVAGVPGRCGYNTSSGIVVIGAGKTASMAARSSAVKVIAALEAFSTARSGLADLGMAMTSPERMDHARSTWATEASWCWAIERRRA